MFFAFQALHMPLESSVQYFTEPELPLKVTPHCHFCFITPFSNQTMTLTYSCYIFLKVEKELRQNSKQRCLLISKILPFSYPESLLYHSYLCFSSWCFSFFLPNQFTLGNQYMSVEHMDQILGNQYICIEHMNKILILQ